MLRRRARDLGHFHHPNIELMIFIVILSILAAIAIPQIVAMMEKRGPQCLEQLVAGTKGPLPADAVCPKSDKPYALGDVVACPAPEKHLDSQPRFVRAKDGAWSLQQTLPAAAGAPVAFDSGRTTVHESPGRLAVHVVPGRVARWFLGPLFFVILVGMILTALVQAVTALAKRTWSDAGLPLLTVAILVPLTWVELLSFSSSHEFVLERGRVTRVDYRLGKRHTEQVFDGCLGIVPTTPALSSSARKLFLVHGGGITLLGPVAADRPDVAARLNRALGGP